MARQSWAHVSAAALCMIGPGAGSFAQEPSGRAVGVIPDASALSSDGSRLLAVQQPVYMGDRIQTGSRGEAQIHFVDATRLVVGPASSLLIDSSVMRNSKTLSSFAVRALRGTFRFISGSSPKPAYSIVTPTATIGVRGTEFDLTILPDGSTEFVLLHGGADICDRYGGCVRVNQACDFISVPPSGPIRRVDQREQRNSRLRAHFPYVLNQDATLRQEFRANVRSCGNIAALPVIPENRIERRSATAAAVTPPRPAPNPPPKSPPAAPPEPPAAPPSPPVVATPRSLAPVEAPKPSPIPDKPISKPGHGKPHHGHGKPDRGNSKPDHEHGKPDHGFGKPDRGHGKPGNDRGFGKAGERPNGHDVGGDARGRKDSDKRDASRNGHEGKGDRGRGDSADGSRGDRRR